jgi:hypothetical protein
MKHMREFWKRFTKNAPYVWKRAPKQGAVLKDDWRPVVEGECGTRAARAELKKMNRFSNFSQVN